MENEISLLCLNPNTKFWYFRAGERARYYTDFKYNNYISAGSDFVKLSKIHKDILESQQEGYISEKGIQNIYENIFIEVHDRVTRESERYKKIEKKELPLDEKQEQLNKILKNSRKDAISRARNAFLLEQQISIGDIVIVPTYASKKLLIGIVFSQVNSDPTPYFELYEGEDKKKEYERASYTMKRQVFWIREVDYTEFPRDLQGIKLHQRAITELTEHIDSLQLLLANQFVFNNRVYTRIDVKTNKPVLSTDLFNLQKSINDLNTENIDIIQKTQISSPGWIELITNFTDWRRLLIVFSGLIGTQIVKNSKIKLEDVVKLIPKTKTREIFLKNREAENLEADIRVLKAKQEKKELQLIVDEESENSILEIPSKTNEEVSNVRATLEIEERKIITLPAYNQEKNLENK